MIPLSLAFTLAMLSLNVALYLTLKTFTETAAGSLRIHSDGGMRLFL